MAEIVKMPKLSDTMTEGVVAEWHKKVGDFVESGELLAEIETDKATMEFESFQDGVLLHIGVEKGKTAPVDSILAILGEEGEDVKELLAQEKSKESEDTAPASEKEEEANKSKDTDSAEQKESEKKSTGSTAQEKAEQKSTSITSNGRVKASPLAKRLAEEKGIDIYYNSRDHRFSSSGLRKQIK